MVIQTVRIEYKNAVWAKIVADWAILDAIQDAFAIFTEGYYFQPLYKKGLWDGRIRFIRQDGSVYVGLVPAVLEWLETNYEDVVVDVDEEVRSQILSRDKIDMDEFVQSLKGLDLKAYCPREHQLRAVHAALSSKRGLIVHATGSGKSFTIAMIIVCLKAMKGLTKFLLIVPRIQLVEQMRSDFISYGIDPKLIGVFYGKEKDVDGEIIISTWQSVYGRTLPWVEDRQCVLVDETHGLKAKAIRGILESCKQGIYRLGLTGTLPDSPSDLNLIMGLTGPVLDEEKTDVLIDKGILSGIQVNVCAITYSKEQKKMLRELTNEFGATQTSYQLERRFLEENPMRNALIAKTAGTLMKEGKNVLILVEKLAHGEKLKEVVLSETGIEPEFIQGSMDVDDREDIRKGLEDHGGSVTIGTYGCVSLGINVRRLHAIVFAASGKSKIRVLQSIGRALRTHKDKVLAQIYDFNDNLQYGKAHAKARINFYVKNDFPMCASEVTIA